MKLKKLDGIIFDKMLRNGLNNLHKREAEVNALNVFPVADGDTATNMCHTLENGLYFAKAVPPMGAYLKQLSNGMLLGARGNSGVILSQIFSGIFQELTHCGSANAVDVKNALIRGYRTAYMALEQPTEGTILTVAREGIEHIKSQISRDTTIEMLFAMYLAEMQKTLPNTPKMLPVLREAGVIDSGALGFIIIVEGMVKLLNGEIVEAIRDLPAAGDANEESAKNVFDAFSEKSVFNEGYCMEFILQCLNGDGYANKFRMDSYVEVLKRFGSSIATVQDGKRIKVHIHTKLPEKVIALSRRYGEFLDFKLDNMDVQHHEQFLKKKPVSTGHKTLSIVCVADGEGMKKIFSELGADTVIDGGPLMNTSSGDFVDAFKRADADHIVVLPNNKNIIPSAEQAVSISGRKDVTVLPTTSMAEGYFALAMDVPGNDDVTYRIDLMTEGIRGLDTVLVTTASRDYSYREISCRAGDEIALLGGELVSVQDDAVLAAIGGIKSVPCIDEKETCVIFLGCDATDALRDSLSLRLDEEFPLMEKEYLDGGQSTYSFIVGIM